MKEIRECPIEGGGKQKPEKWGKPMFLRLYFLSEFFPGFPKEKNQNREQLQSSGKHVKREDQLGQGRKDPEVSGRADQGKTGTHIV